MRTEHSRTPHQLWILGMAQAGTENPLSREVEGVAEIENELRITISANVFGPSLTALSCY